MDRVLVSRKAITVRPDLLAGPNLLFFLQFFRKFHFQRGKGSISSKCAQKRWQVVNTNTVGVDFPKFQISASLPWEKKARVCPRQNYRPSHEQQSLPCTRPRASKRSPQIVNMARGAKFDFFLLLMIFFLERYRRSGVFLRARPQHRRIAKNELEKV